MAPNDGGLCRELGEGETDKVLVQYRVAVEEQDEVPCGGAPARVASERGSGSGGVEWDRTGTESLGECQAVVSRAGVDVHDLGG